MPEIVPVEDSIFNLTRDELDRYPVGVITLDRAGSIVRYNRAESVFARRQPRDVIGRNFFVDVAPCTGVREFFGRFEEFAQKDGSGAEKFDFRFGFAWGSQDVVITLVRRADYKEIYVIIQVKSSLQKSALVEVERTKRVGPTPAATFSRIGHAIEDRTGMSYGSDELLAILGVDRESFVTNPRRFESFVHSADVTRVANEIEAARLERRAANIEHRIVTGNGKIRTVRYAHVAAQDLDRPSDRQFITIVDLTDQLEVAQRWWHSAHFDALTSLPNRSLFSDRLAAALAKPDATLAVLFIDLDRFKLVNDTAGHDVGDRLLQAVASRLTACVRRDDTMARLNGDEFVAMMSGVDSHAQASGIAEAMIAAIAKPFLIDQREYYVSLSVGIAHYPKDASDSDSLMQAADMAMYQAKQSGPGVAFEYDAEMGESTRLISGRLQELRRAIDVDEFILEYQPIFEGNGRLAAVETLVRWNHPTLGILPPSEFIELAEKSGLIGNLGALVLRRACLQMHEWHRNGIDVPRITVNVSPLQLKSAQFPNVVTNALSRAQLDPGVLELEITESFAVDEPEETLVALAELKLLGIRIAIDDFGTGYSSLASLKYLPVDTLKIDRAFVSGVGTTTLDDTIVMTVLALAKILRLDVIAEGVETLCQLERLRELGCDYVQGFHMARPMHPDALARRMTIDRTAFLQPS